MSFWKYPHTSGPAPRRLIYTCVIPHFIHFELSRNVCECLRFVQRNVTPVFKSHRCGLSLCCHSASLRSKPKPYANILTFWSRLKLLLHKINFKSMRCVSFSSFNLSQLGNSVANKQSDSPASHWSPTDTNARVWELNTTLPPLLTSVIHVRPAAGPWKGSYLLAAVRSMRATLWRETFALSVPLSSRRRVSQKMRSESSWKHYNWATLKYIIRFVHWFAPVESNSATRGVRI